MTEASKAEAVQAGVAQRRSWGLLVGLSAGHTVKHFYQQGIILLIPSVKAALGLSDVEVGFIGTARTISSATINIPAGIMADMWRSKVALMLTASMTSLGLGYLLLGLTPNYWLLLLGVAITGSGTSLWHAPAFSTLAVEYPERRAMAMAFHRTGGSIGDSVSPLAMGLLLGGFALWGMEWGGLYWQSLALILVVPVLLGAMSILVFYRGLTGSGGRSPSLKAYLSSARPLLTNGTVMGMVLLSGVRSMAHSGLNIFLVIYMSEDLGYSDFKIGFHISLLTLFGIISGPALGWASDRIGRRPVLFLGLTAMAILIFAMLPFGSGWSLTIILAFLGVFLYSINPVMMAAALDATKKGVEGSGVALMFTGAAVFGAFSPVIAGWLRESRFGMDGVFYYSATIVGAIALASLFIPIRKVTERSSQAV